MTIKDIARKCGVSVTTVSRALNNLPGINQETKEMILRVVKEEGFVPNSNARVLKQHESNTIVVIVKGIENLFYQPMITEILENINTEKYSMMLHYIPTNEDEVGVAQQIVIERKPKGIIFLGGYFINEGDRIKSWGVPCVVAASGRVDEDSAAACSYFSVDDFKESYRAVESLIQKGHRKIAFLCSCKDEPGISYNRLEGYKKALEDHQIDVDERLIIYSNDDENAYTVERGYTDTRMILKNHIDCTAIFAISDLVAMGVCRALIDAGKSIPGDYSVMGYDGLEILKYNNPSLTTIKQPVKEMARRSVKTLFDMINGTQDIVHCVMECELIERETTASIK